MRIVHVTNEPFGITYANGVQHAVYGLAHAQASAGNVVAVFSRDDQGTHVLGEALSAEAAAESRPSVPNVSSKRLSRYFEPQLAGRILGWKPDIVHLHSVHIPQNVALAAFLVDRSIPYCVSVHGALFRPALRRRFSRKLIFKWLFERRYLNRASFVHALSPAEERAVRDYGVHTAVVVIPNGVPSSSDVTEPRNDRRDQRHGFADGPRVFLFLGRIDPWQKGLDLLLRGFALANPSDLAVLAIVGDDQTGASDQLRHLAARLGIASVVSLSGPVFGPERDEVFARSDVFVHTSRWEGISLSVLAAAAAGKPCVLTAEADPLGELHRAHAAFIVEPSVTGISGGLRKAIDATGADLAAMGARARAAVERRFAWTEIERQLRGAYQTATGIR